MHSLLARSLATATRLSAVAEHEEASERGRRLIDAIVLAGENIGPLPLAAFEVESSWRSRKHVKGSYLNLLDVGAALGVIVLAGEVLHCLHVVLNEEWEHNQYANRDLAALEGSDK